MGQSVMFFGGQTNATINTNTNYPIKAVEKCSPLGNANVGVLIGPGKEFFLYPFLVRYLSIALPNLPPGATGLDGIFPIGTSLIFSLFLVRYLIIVGRSSRRKHHTGKGRKKRERNKALEQSPSEQQHW